MSWGWNSISWLNQAADCTRLKLLNYFNSCKMVERSWLPETWFLNRENFMICNKHFVWNEDWAWKNFEPLPRSRNCGPFPCSVCGKKMRLQALRSYCLVYECFTQIHVYYWTFENFRISHEFWKVGTSFQSCLLSQNVKSSFQTEHDAKETPFGLHNR